MDRFTPKRTEADCVIYLISVMVKDTLWIQDSMVFLHVSTPVWWNMRYLYV